MNVAYLDPAYSRHFHHLAQAIASQTGGQALALLSSPAYRLYTHGDRDRLWTLTPGAPPCEVPEDFGRCMLVDTRDPAFAEVFASAVAWFQDVFRRERIEVCLAFSDVRPFSVAARLAAEREGVTCVWFERGAYRYGTSSLSTSGLNARFDLATARMQTEVEGMSVKQRMRRREPVRWLKLRFAMFMAWNQIAGMRHRPLQRLQHKRYGWRHYLQLAWRQFFDGRRVPAPQPAAAVGDRPRPVILVPLQLATDSQFLSGSPFPDIRAFVDYLMPEILGACPDARILVKKHPMDPGRYELPRGADWVGGPLSRLFAGASAVVCINSNVGYEAATYGKRVLCFGESFYTAGPIISRVTRENFRDRLRAALVAGDDPAAGLALRALVLRHYQTPGDCWAYTSSDIQASATVVLQHVASAQARRDARAAAAKVAEAAARATADRAPPSARADGETARHAATPALPLSVRANPASG